MAQLVIEVPDGAHVAVLRAAAAEAGFPPTNAGVKAWVLAWLREQYRARKELEARRQVAATVDAAANQARTEAGGIT